MAKRIRKPPIKPEIRRDWLKRNEEDGESPPHIAEKDHYDVRTVRKQVELAKQEREVREARSIVLRNALERHYDDLRKFAEKLNSEISGAGSVPASPDDDLMEAALRQHLPRSPIWGYMLKWKNLQQRLNEEQQNLEKAIKEAVETNGKLAALERIGLEGVVPGVIAALTAEVKHWSNSNIDYTLRDSLDFEPAGEGLVNTRFGFAHMGVMEKKIAEKNMPIVKDALADLETDVKGLEAYLNLEKTLTEISRLRGKLREELAVIRLRRIVPGRCRYCPI